ncbi:helix-turn-helix domain-containing protein [Streptomyces sp. NPDC005132]|uniref:helix-turn-helix domain-containing protein n=1 Tax=Streptomyces sp. NPDC005132 TaxID=3154294 RepID=UPI0033B1C704
MSRTRATPARRTSDFFPPCTCPTAVGAVGGCAGQWRRFALDPNATQVPLLYSHGGGARAAFNWAVARVKANWEQREAEASYGLGEEEVTPWRGWSLPALRKAYNAATHSDPRFALGF